MQSTIDTKQLMIRSYEMRIAVIEMLEKAESGHVGGALGIADVMTYLYFRHLKHNSQNPGWSGRDYFLMSNGHVCSIWYAVLAHSGYFPVTDLTSLRKIGSHLQGHPKNTSTPGVTNSSGPLGHGEAQAVGIALGLKLDNKDNQVYCLMSDGEQQEGAVWESALNAAKYRLNNLTFILDQNGIQIDGRVEDIMPLPDLGKIYGQIGFTVISIDGHNWPEIESAFQQPTTKPKLIIANTIPGKGVSYMENNYKFHDWKNDTGRPQEAILELKQHIDSISTQV